MLLRSSAGSRGDLADLGARPGGRYACFCPHHRAAQVLSVTFCEESDPRQHQFVRKTKACDPGGMVCCWYRHRSDGSLSAVSQRIFARKYAFESSRRDLHNVAGLFIIIILFYFIVIFLFSDPFARRLIIRQIPEDFLVISCGVKIFSVWRWGKDLWHKLFTFGAAWAPRATLPRVWCTAATAKASLAAVQSFSFLSFGAADQGAPVRCVTEPATTVNSWRESTLLCEIFGSSLGSNPCRQPTTSSKAGQRASACREKNKRLPMRRSQT